MAIEARKGIFVFTFVFVCISIMAASLVLEDPNKEFLAKVRSTDDTVVSQSRFTEALFFRVQGEDYTFRLEADELIVDNITKDIHFIKPEGEAIANGRAPIHYKAEKGDYYSGIQKLFLSNNVKLNDTLSKITAKDIIYDMKQNFVLASTDVKTNTLVRKTKDRVTINSRKLLYWPSKEVSQYIGDVNGRLVRNLAYEQGVEFSSDSLYLSVPEATAKLKNNVELKRLQVVAESREGEIFFENFNKRLKYFTLSDDVKLKEKVELANGRILTRRAFAEKLEGVTSEDKLVLSGYPKIIQDNDVIKGNRIILRHNTETVEVDDASSKFTFEK